MAQGIQRNDAEIFATIAGNKNSSIYRNDFGLMTAQAINSMSNKIERR